MLFNQSPFKTFLRALVDGVFDQPKSQGLPPPPPGLIYLVDDSGNFLVDDSGNFLVANS